MSHKVNPKTVELLNYRIQQEEFSSRMYYQMYLWLDNAGYMNSSKVWQRYAEEEYKHKTWAEEWLLSFGVMPCLCPLESPIETYASLADIIEATYLHEEDVTKQCNDLYAYACENETSLIPLALKYVSEQVEEMNKVITLKDVLNSFGTDKMSLFLLDINIEKYT